MKKILFFLLFVPFLSHAQFRGDSAIGHTLIGKVKLSNPTTTGVSDTTNYKPVVRKVGDSTLSTANWLGAGGGTSYGLTPVRFKVGDGAPNTPANSVNYYTNPSITGLRILRVSANGAEIYAQPTNIYGWYSFPNGTDTVYINNFGNFPDSSRWALDFDNGLPLLGFPVTFTCTDSNTTIIKLAWASVPSATSYTVEQALNSGFTSGLATIFTGSGTSTNATGLSPGTTYFFRVHATAAGFTPGAYVITNCTTSSGGSPIAQAYIDSVLANGASLSSSQQQFITTFDSTNNANGLNSHIFACYLTFMGVNSANKFNLINPTTFTISFNGSWTVNTSGITGDASTAWGDTHFNPSTSTTINALGMGVYSRTNGYSGPYAIGSSNGVNLTLLNLNTAGGGSITAEINASGFNTATATDTRLVYIQRGGSTQISMFRDGTGIVGNPFSQASTTAPNFSMYIGALNVSGSPGFFSNVNTSLIIITDGSLTGTQITNLTNAVNALMTSFGINV